VSLRGFLGTVITAIFAALAVAGGVLAGSATYGQLHPGFERIVWTEHTGAVASGDPVVRRALFSDGRFLALGGKGYVAGLVSTKATAEIFALAASASEAWKTEYPAAGPTGELIDLTLDGPAPRSLRIGNPETNLGLPATLGRLIVLLGVLDRQDASVSFRPAGLIFHAARVSDTGGLAADRLPPNFPLDAAATASGTRIDGRALSVLEQYWPDLERRLGPGQSHRFVQSGSTIWRISWTLDLMSIGSTVTPPGTPNP